MTRLSVSSALNHTVPLLWLVILDGAIKLLLLLCQFSSFTLTSFKARKPVDGTCMILVPTLDCYNIDEDCIVGVFSLEEHKVVFHKTFSLPYT